MPDDNFLKWFRNGMVAFGLIFVVAGAGFHWWASGRAAAAADWPRAEGEVVDSRVEARSSSSSSSTSSGRSMNSRSYAPVIVYRYLAGGRIHESQRIWLDQNQTFAFQSSARAFVERYPVGSKVSVLVNPDDPSDAALISDGAPWWLWLFVVAGVAIAAAGWFLPRLFSGPLQPVEAPRSHRKSRRFRR